MGNGVMFLIFLIFRVTIPAAVLMEMVRTMPSAPGWVWTILPIFHWSGGRLSSRMMTKVPFRSLISPWVHFVRIFRPLRYSLCQRVQKFWRIFCRCCHLDNLLMGVSLKSYSGMSVNGWPIEKWPGVSGDRWLGSVDIGIRGREFSIPSI